MDELESEADEDMSGAMAASQALRRLPFICSPLGASDDSSSPLIGCSGQHGVSRLASTLDSKMTLWFRKSSLLDSLDLHW